MMHGSINIRSKKYFIHLPMKMEPTVSSETSAIRTQTPGNYPKKEQITFRKRRKLKNKDDTPLLHKYSGPSVSAMLGSIPGSPFLELYQVPAAIPLDSLQWCRIFDPSSEASACGRGKRHGGADRISGTAVAQWLRCCGTNRKVADSIPAGVIGIFH